jgi:pyruvate dehydrogenase E1 component
LLGSGPILRLVREAADILRERFEVAVNVWSVTSYKELRRDALAVQRWNMLHPTEPPRKPYVAELLEQHPAPVVAASDYLKLVADQIAPWVPGGMLSLGTDGFGRSDTRERLRHFFEVDANFITAAALYELARHGRIPFELVRKAINEFDIDPERADPLTV